MSQTLSAALKLTDNYTATMKKIIQSQDEYEKKQRQIDKAIDKSANTMKSGAQTGIGGIDSLATKIGSLVSVTSLAKKALKGMFSVINTSALQTAQENTFQALLNSDQVGTQLYQYVGAYAKTSALGREDLAKGMTTFLTVTRDINQLEQLMKMTERLYAKDPNQGAQGAVATLKEALSGDTTSLQNRYGIAGLSGDSLRTGDVASNLEQIDSAMNQFGATQELVDKNFNNLTTQIDIFKGNLQTTIADESTPIMMTLSGVVQQLNSDMEAGKFQPFINLMVNGMDMIGKGIAWVAENANWLIPVVAGVVAGIVAYNIATAVAAVVTMALSQNWVGIALMAVAVTGAVIGMSAAMSEVEAKSAGTVSNLSDLKNQAGQGLANTPLPTEITNTDPIKVTGKVDIEKENMKYLMEIANSKFIAQYSHNTVIPQTNIHATIEKTVDADEILGKFAYGIAEASAMSPQGVY